MHLWEGRSVDQKRALVRAITEAMVEHADASAGGLHVWVEEYSRESWARAGVLAVDRPDEGAPADRPPCVWQLDHVVLEVADMHAAEAFYADLLGFTVRERREAADGRTLTVTDQGLVLAPKHREPAEESGRRLVFRARGLAGIAERARAVTRVDGPHPSAGGLAMSLRDPDGNEIELRSSQ